MSENDLAKVSENGPKSVKISEIFGIKTYC